MTKYIKNIFFGIIVLAGMAVLIKLSGWSPLNLLLSPQYESKKETVTERVADTQQLWWLSDYPKLIHKIDTTTGKRLNTSWKTGPEEFFDVSLRSSVPYGYRALRRTAHLFVSSDAEPSRHPEVGRQSDGPKVIVARTH